MATITWLNGGVDQAAKLIIHKVASGVDLVMRLFTNNHAPVVTDTHSAFTICTLSGYADATLTGATWTGSTSAGIAAYAYPAITFTFSAYAGGTTIYGVVYEDGSNNSYGAALLDTPYAVPAGGGSLVITPTFGQKQCP